MSNSMQKKRRHRIRISVLLVTAFGISPPLLGANEAILPGGWDPSVTDAVDYLQTELEQEQAQQGINRLTAQISSLLDAELFIAYVRLFDHLEPRAQTTLKREQSDWLKQRVKVTSLAGKKEEGGSASPMESNDAFADFTRKRIQLLNDRLKKLGIEAGEQGLGVPGGDDEKIASRFHRIKMRLAEAQEGIIPEHIGMSGFHVRKNHAGEDVLSAFFDAP